MRELLETKVERIPLRQRNHFQIFVIKFMLAEKHIHETTEEWNEKVSVWSQAYAKEISNIIDNEENLNIRSLIIEEKYKEASVLVMKILEEKEEKSILEKMKDPKALDRNNSSVESSILQVENIAKYAKIELNSSGDNLDPRIVLYVILRLASRPKGVKYHYSQMDDQSIFGKALRMLGDTDSLQKLIKAYPNISFSEENNFPPQ